MAETNNIFNLFCRYVDDTIFKENIGSTVSFIIDQSYIDSFCEKYSITEVELLREVSRNMYRLKTSVDHIKGIVAIQVYAATKRAEDALVSSSNYKTRYADLLSWDIADVSWWFREFQDYTWQTLYQWCDKNHFKIAQSTPRFGIPYGYVQYPLQQAERVFTKDELLYIAYAFVESHLYPDDDISFAQFWKIIHWGAIGRCLPYNNRHAINLYQTRAYYDDARKQIFNYFLRWNGEYKQYSKVSTIRTQRDLFVYVKDNLETIDIRTGELKLVRQFPLCQFSHHIFKNNKELFPHRRDDLILFKRDDVYDNYWQETRFLEGEEEGIAIIFSDRTNRWIQFPKSDLLKSYGSVKIYKVVRNRWSQELYEDVRNYKLEGGLKIGRSVYLLGAAPVFRIDKDSIFWLDGELQTSTDGVFYMNHLKEGVHSIHIVGYKDITFEIVDSPFRQNMWGNDNCQWNIDKNDNIWKPAKIPTGVIGIDMRNICVPKYMNGDTIPTLCAWARVHQKMSANSQNIIVKTVENINDYE